MRDDLPETRQENVATPAVPELRSRAAVADLDAPPLDVSAPLAPEISPASTYVDLLTRLSGSLQRVALTGARLQSDVFLERLADFRRRVRGGEHGSVVSSFPDACDDYLARARAYLQERDDEYLELVDVLRETIARITGESGAFHAELMGVSERLTTFADLDDIRQIKERVARESAHLQEAAEEQKRQAEQTLAGLTRRVETLEASLDAATEQAETARFDKTLDRWLQSFQATGQPFVLALADVDDFKVVNDTHGHQVGDRVLLATAQWLSASIRGTDLVARYGGEEFAILFSRVGLAQAEGRLGEVFRTLASKQFAYDADDGERAVRFTVSAGMADSVAGDTAESLIRRADEGLYEAKRAGKNRIVVRKKSRLAALFG
jgi:diguanylate cyclase